MSSDVISANPNSERPTSEASRSGNSKPIIVILAVYWIAYLTVRFLEMPYFFRFLWGMAAPALLLIAFSIWWMRCRSVNWPDRILGYLLLIGGAFLVAPLTHASIGLPTTLMLGIPVILTFWPVWLIWSQWSRKPIRRMTSLLVIAGVWLSLTLIRVDGLNGDLIARPHWRWTPTAEEIFLADRTLNADSVELIDVEQQLTLNEGDWPGFRGPKRDGKVMTNPFATDWGQRPPKLLWKHRLGPAWSSVIVVGDRVFTQEQRGELEAVVCYAAATGAELWCHEDRARFWEAVSGPGPRATPEFFEGKIYTVGATGLLNCLDARTGKVIWAHNLQEEVAAKAPMWGMSSSPLLEDGLVIVFTGSQTEDSLVAYDANSGGKIWSAAAGKTSYSSPQSINIDGQKKILMLSDGGLIAFAPETGARLWQAGLAMEGPPRNLQSHLIENHQLLSGSLAQMGLSLIQIVPDGDGWKSAPVWDSMQMKPEFSEVVVHKGYVYGIDGAVFTCLDLETGKKKWRGGRYGRGQVLLLENLSLLLVLSESGEAVLLKAQPEKHEEIGKFQAVTGKTWNHPVIAHGKMLIRNAEEIACYELEQIQP